MNANNIFVLKFEKSNATLVKKLGMGFTLVELLITITIAAILATLALPSFNQMLERSRVSAITSQLMGALTYARNEAVTRNSHVVVCRVNNAQLARPVCATNGSAWDNGWMIFIDDDNNNVLSNTETLLRVISAIPTNYSVLTQGPATTWIAFNANGIARFKGGVLGVTFAITPPTGVASASAKLVTVDVTGRARLSD